MLQEIGDSSHWTACWSKLNSNFRAVYCPRCAEPWWPGASLPTATLRKDTRYVPGAVPAICSAILFTVPTRYRCDHGKVHCDLFWHRAPPLDGSRRVSAVARRWRSSCVASRAWRVHRQQRPFCQSPYRQLSSKGQPLRRSRGSADLIRYS